MSDQPEEARSKREDKSDFRVLQQKVSSRFTRLLTMETGAFGGYAHSSEWRRVLDGLLGS